MLSLAEVHKVCPWVHNPSPKPIEEQDPDIVAMFGGEDADYQVTLGMLEPDAADMDVNSIWHSMMSVARANGTTLIGASGVSRGSRSNGVWNLTVDTENAAPVQVTADLVVNAGGAWADHVAQALGVKTCGLTPRQRTIIQFDPNEVAGGLDSQPNYLLQQSTWYVYIFVDMFIYDELYRSTNSIILSSTPYLCIFVSFPSLGPLSSIWPTVTTTSPMPAAFSPRPATKSP